VLLPLLQKNLQSTASKWNHVLADQYHFTCGNCRVIVHGNPDRLGKVSRLIFENQVSRSSRTLAIDKIIARWVECQKKFEVSISFNLMRISIL
jgi:hypothetical protein